MGQNSERPSRVGERRLLCAATIVIVLTCVVTSMIWWPMYYNIIHDVLPRRAVLLQGPDPGALLKALPCLWPRLNVVSKQQCMCHCLVYVNALFMVQRSPRPLMVGARVVALMLEVHAVPAPLPPSEPPSEPGAEPDDPPTLLPGQITINSAPLDAKRQLARNQTFESGHGVSVDPAWRNRRPDPIEDSELVEEKYLMDTCAARLADCGHVGCSCALFLFFSNCVSAHRSVSITDKPLLALSVQGNDAQDCR